MTPLAASLAARLHDDGPITFGAFVAAALYDPHHGFYVDGGHAGRRGDFLTSPEVGPLFGAVLVRAFEQWWTRLGRPDHYTVIECGAGPGTLARAVRRAATGEFAEALEYVTVEQSDAQRARHPAEVTAHATLDDVPGGAITGAIVANELLDNLPFDLVEWRGSAWHDVLVDVDAAGALCEVLGEERRDLAAVPGVRDGARRPVQGAAVELVRAAQERLARGDVVIIDYARGTDALVATPWLDWVRTYRAHERGGLPLDDPGTQDITCDVDTDALAAAAGDPDEMVTQAAFLAAHGIDALVAEGRAAWQAGAGTGGLAALHGRSRIREAEALCEPSGLGGFTVMRWIR